MNEIILFGGVLIGVCLTFIAYWIKTKITRIKTKG